MFVEETSREDLRREKIDSNTRTSGFGMHPL
jgi:hypothetical protein